MRIGINTLFMIPNKVGGTETYLRGLIHGLSKIDKENEYILFTNQENHKIFKIREDNFSKGLCNIPPQFKTFRVFYEQTILPWNIRKLKIDVLHSPGYVSPIRVKCAKVVTIHDMQYFYYPQNFPKARLLYWKYLIPISSRKSDVVVTVSNNSRDDIITLLGIPEEKIVVSYEASKFSIDGLNKIGTNENTLGKYGIKGDYILSVASLLPHKNLHRLIEGFNLLSNRINHYLVLVGIKGNALNTIKDTIEKKDIEKRRVILLGHVSDSELTALYQKASLFIMPSLFEGFGIPLVEAMSLGCPVAASNRTCIPEIVGDAGILFNPEDPKAITAVIYSILSDIKLRNDLVKKGYERVKMFSWEKMAHETLKAYYIAHELYQKRYKYVE